MIIIARAALAAGLAAFAATVATAQDAAKVDPKHYKVIIDNAQVRVLRVHYGPHESSVMHSHPDGVVTYLSDGQMKFQLPGGKTITRSGRRGETIWTPAGPHLPTNAGNTPFDAVLVELKGGAAHK
ncbi:cupin domain-containing protein [Sphingomonas sp.]|uniref:cupin domain-containing protein n=1 Tax=Sphingomonas sp. TaxID=28214 RepID=UPI0025E639A4|nr:cupin domain-containing protein [Sphingomonas sp.]MBV9528281.1 hypothetical protein [Sphingomonas sp.]